ncbi:MAG: TIM44-like domain-containing protein [Peptoniphilaceae bacterium]|nr:TIM44-like domain-containing protein [Peptoniphilaceae bacterium]MDY6086304.1 TIM44-like domain-containing protein [Peptoniphilaceae bacterium]
MKRKRIVLLVLFLALVLTSNFALADVGGGVDHGGGNWGGDLGGGVDIGGGYGSTFGFNPFMFFYLTDNPFVLLVVIAIVAVMRYSKRHPNTAAQDATRSTAKPYQPKSVNQNLDELVKKDPNFSEPAFLLRVSDVFIALQQAWTAKNWRAIRPFESNALYAQHERQLQDLIDRGQTNVVEDISVMNTFIESYASDSENDYLNAIIEARYRDYVVDDATGELVKGDRNRRYIMTYRMQFMRKKDVQTESTTETSVTECPNCGAPLAINQNGVCEYCGSEVTTGTMQWVLTALQPLQQRIA